MARLVTHVGDDVAALVRELAAREDRSVSWVVEQALLKFLGPSEDDTTMVAADDRGGAPAQPERGVGGTRETKGPVSRYFDR